MNVKIQGSGNGTYANTGSCVAVTNYLQHEDLERMKKGEEVQPFFNQFRDYVSAREVTFKIDNNKAKLSRTDAKFYVITVSPSEKELRCMGRTPQECAEALRRYIRQDVMRNYAEGFGKGLKSDDVEYYAKIHFNRDGESDSDMHAHIIVSRKDRSNTRKLSPKTNHTGKKNCGNVKGGFDRTDFFRKCESSFDRRMGFDREPEESFDYLNAVKNGSPAEIARQVERAERIRKEKWDKLKAELQSRQEPEKSKNQQVEKTPDIEQPIPKKKQQEEDLELLKKPKRRWKIQCKLPPKTKRFCPLKTFNNAPLKSLDRWGYYYFSLFPSVCSHFTDTFSCQLNPVRRMYNTIHNGICYCRVSDCIIPIVRWQLRGDDDGLAPMSVLYYIEQDGSFLGIKVHKEEVIQYEQRAPFDSLEFRFQCAFYFCHLKRTHKFRSIRIICPYALLAGFIPHCCGKEALPGTG